MRYPGIRERRMRRFVVGGFDIEIVFISWQQQLQFFTIQFDTPNQPLEFLLTYI